MLNNLFLTFSEDQLHRGYHKDQSTHFNRILPVFIILIAGTNALYELYCNIYLNEYGMHLQND